jgi:hypothetical protein
MNTFPHSHEPTPPIIQKNKPKAKISLHKASGPEFATLGYRIFTWTPASLHPVTDDWPRSKFIHKSHKLQYFAGISGRIRDRQAKL